MLSTGVKVNAEESLLNKYVVAWYFINTIFSTVGFGDIKAESQTERIFMVWMDGLMKDRWMDLRMWMDLWMYILQV